MSEEYSEYKQHLDVVEPDAFIGNVCWYSISTDVSIPRSELEAALVDQDLGAFLPRAAAASDVFRRACSGAQQKGIPTVDPKVFSNFMLRNPGNDDTRIIRRVVREEVDENNLRLGYSETAEVSFDRTNESASFTILVDDDATKEICRQIISDYQTERERLNHNAVREVIKKVLRCMDATNIRYPSGGVYFVPNDHSAMLEKLENVFSAFPEGLTVHSLRLLDDRKQRGLLKKAFEAESTDRVKTLINEISDIRLRGAGLTQSKYEAYLADLLETQEKMKQYESILQTELSTGTSALGILKEMVFSLKSEVRDDKRKFNGRKKNG